MKICIWTGAAYEDWGPFSLEGGIGGSEIAAIHIGEELARLGHEVVMVGQHHGHEGTYYAPRAVEYVHYQRAIEDTKLLACDVFVSSRDKQVLRLKPDAKVKVLWVHDIHVGDDWQNEVPPFDRVYCLTKWHKRFFEEHYPNVEPSRVVATRNGIDATRFAPGTAWEELRAGKGPSFIWSSSLDRGLDAMLDLWPEIKKIEPKATLEIYYGIDNWKKINKDNPTGLTIIDFFMDRIASMGDQGVEYVGRVGQKALAEAHMRSLIWAYPTAWMETSCITAMEAQAAGAFPIASDLAALPETVHSGFLVPGRNKSTAYKQLFLAYVREVLTGESAMDHRGPLDHDAIRRGNREHAMLEMTWSKVAREWSHDFGKLLEAR